VHATVVQDVPQLAPVLMGFSQPFVVEPSQLRKPVGQLAQAPPVHVCVFAPHAAAEPHAPLAVQVWTLLPEHCVAPGAHTPVQLPLTHAWFEHAAPFCQFPPPSQV
jgi:hypothetical protein